MKLPKTTRPLVYLYLYMHCLLFFIAYSFSPIQRAPAKICLDHRIWGLKLLGQEDGSFGSGPRSFAGFAYAGVGMFQTEKRFGNPCALLNLKKHACTCVHFLLLCICIFRPDPLRGVYKFKNGLPWQPQVESALPFPRPSHAVTWRWSKACGGEHFEDDELLVRHMCSKKIPTESTWINLKHAPDRSWTTPVLKGIPAYLDF